MKVELKFKRRGDMLVINDTRKGFSEDSDLAISVLSIYFLMQELNEKGMDMGLLMEDITKTFCGKSPEKSVDGVNKLVKDLKYEGMLHDFFEMADEYEDWDY